VVCDVVALNVGGIVAPSGIFAVDRATVRQKKDGAARQFRVGRTDPPSGRNDYVRAAAKKPSEFYVHRPPWFGKEHHDEKQYARHVSEWIASQSA